MKLLSSGQSRCAELAAASSKANVMNRIVYVVEGDLLSIDRVDRVGD